MIRLLLYQTEDHELVQISMNDLCVTIMVKLPMNNYELARIT